MAGFQNVVTHGHILPEKVQIGLHVPEKPTNQSGQVYDMSWFVLLEQGHGFGRIQQVGILGR